MLRFYESTNEGSVQYIYIASPSLVIVADFPPGDRNKERADLNEAAFESWGFQVLRVMFPSAEVGLPSYTNAIVLNDIVLVPIYDGYSTQNNDAMAIFAMAFPDKVIISINASESVDESGAVHCATMTRPDVTGWWEQ